MGRRQTQEGGTFFRTQHPGEQGCLAPVLNLCTYRTHLFKGYISSIKLCRMVPSLDKQTLAMARRSRSDVES